MVKFPEEYFGIHLSIGSNNGNHDDEVTVV